MVMRRSLLLATALLSLGVAALVLPIAAPAGQPNADAWQADNWRHTPAWPTTDPFGLRDGNVHAAGSSVMGPASRDLVEEWLYVIAAPALSSPCLADLDGDGVQDIILATYDPVNPYAGARVYAIDMNGNDLPGWPVIVTNGPIPGSPVVADIDNNGDREVIVGSGQRAFIWNHDGSDFPGW